MRLWYKYFLDSKPASGPLLKDQTPDDHARSMRGYAAQKGYASKQDFFSTYYHHGPARYKLYYDYLKEHLTKGKRYLSIGSGRCIIELLLSEDGHDIICSDLAQYCKDETLKIFPDLKFTAFDITQRPFAQKVDAILSLSVLHLFSNDELETVFSNVYESLKPQGWVIIDLGGAPDNLGTYCLDEVLAPLENQTKSLYRRLKGNRERYCVKKHHAYRIKDAELISIARKRGFQLLEKTQGDYDSEVSRSFILSRLPAGLRGAIGRQMPYVRIFNFQKVY